MPRITKGARRFLKRLLAVVLIGLAGLVLWAGLDFAYVSTDNETDQAAPADVIVVLGCPTYENNVPGPTFSACVQARAHHAADLYKRGLAAHIIPTGGLTGPPPSEAAAMAQVVQAEGVPATAIMLEDRAQDTIENIQFSRALMQAHGWRTAILVTEPNHIRRAMLIAHDGGLAVVASPVTDSPGWQNPDARRANLLRDTRTLMEYQVRRLLGLQV